MSKIIFHFLDFEKQEKEPKIIKLKINDKEYTINKILEINIDFSLPFKNCIFYNAPITCLFSNNTTVEYLLTIYYYRINYFIGFSYGINKNSFEFIFATIDKNNFNPKIEINKNSNTFIIYSQEEFESNCNRKRINIFNINVNDICNIDFNDIKEELDFYQNNDLLIILGNDMKILGAHFKSETLRINNISKEKKINLVKTFKNLDDVILNIEKINIQHLKSIMSNIYVNLKYDFDFQSYLKKELDEMDEYDIQIYKLYTIYDLFLQTCFKIKNKSEIEFNQDNFSLFKYLLNNLISFDKESSFIEKEEKTKLYFVANSILIDFHIIYKDNNNYLNECINKNKQLISLIDFTKENIYKESNNKNIEFIGKLKDTSFIFYYLLQFDSCFSRNIVLKNCSSTSASFSMLTLEELKKDLMKCIPKYGIRVFYDNGCYGFTEVIRGVTVINEKKIFKKILSENDLLSFNDKNYYKRFILCFLLKHERFAHLKHTINKSQLGYLNSPKVFYNIVKKNVSIFDNAEIGYSLEYFFSNFDVDFYDKLYLISELETISFDKLFNNVDIWVDESNLELTNEFQNINKKIPDDLNITYENENNLKESNEIKQKSFIKKHNDEEEMFDLSYRDFIKYHYRNKSYKVENI